MDLSTQNNIANVSPKEHKDSKDKSKYISFFINIRYLNFVKLITYLPSFINKIVQIYVQIMVLF